jgi:hypothetical protein
MAMRVCGIGVCDSFNAGWTLGLAGYGISQACYSNTWSCGTLTEDDLLFSCRLGGRVVAVGYRTKGGGWQIRLYTGFIENV